MPEQQHTHWWTTMPGLIAAFAAIITALAALIPVLVPILEKRGWLNPPEPRVDKEISPQAKQKSGERTQNVNVRTPRAIKVGSAFAGFSCDVNSYGTSWAETTRQLVSSDLYAMYGCSVSADAHMKPGYKGDFHTNSAEEPPWKGFASRSTVLYYDAANQEAAEAVASDLTNRYKHKFVSAQGGGQGVLPEWFGRTIIVHLRESGK